MPELHSYLEDEMKLDIDILISSWCITIFTCIN